MSGIFRTGALIAALVVLSGTRSSMQDVVTYESITVSTTAVGLAAATTDPPGRAQVRQCSGRLETAQIRERHDGTNPTSSEGTVIEVGDIVTIASPQDAKRIRFIRTGASDGTLKIHCWQ